jgi:hypothetical protein
MGRELETITGGIMGAFIVAYVALASLPFLYVMVRWRTRSAETTGAGTRGVIAYFLTVASLTLLTCLALQLYLLISKEERDSNSDFQRSLFGVAMGAGTFYVGHLLLWNQRRATAPDDGIHRIFVGFGFVVTGFIFFGSLIALFVAAFSRHESKDALRATASFVVVFGVAHFVRAWMLRTMPPPRLAHDVHPSVPPPLMTPPEPPPPPAA